MIQIRSISAAGEDVVIGDSLNRLLVYSMSGKQRNIITGENPAIASQSKLLMAHEQPEKISVYSLATLEVCQNYVFPSKIAVAGFSKDGNSLLVLTDDQVVYTFNLNAPVSTETAKSPAH